MKSTAFGSFITDLLVGVCFDQYTIISWDGIAVLFFLAELMAGSTTKSEQAFVSAHRVFVRFFNSTMGLGGIVM